jgi:antitoxin Phd
VTKWKFHEAKARLSEVFDAAKRNGPQIVTRRGVEEAVVVPIEEWRRLQERARPSLKELLLSPEPRFDLDIPDRHSYGRREPPEFE